MSRIKMTLVECDSCGCECQEEDTVLIGKRQLVYCQQCYEDHDGVTYDDEPELNPDR